MQLSCLVRVVYTPTPSSGRAAFSNVRTIQDVTRPDRPIQGLLHSALGWSADPPAYAARDVQFVMDEARRTGTTSRPGIRRLQALLREHNKATTPAERNAAAERVRRHAAESRRWYEENAET